MRVVEVPETKFTSSTLDCCTENPYWAEVSMLWSFESLLEEPDSKNAMWTKTRKVTFEKTRSKIIIRQLSLF